MDIRKIKKLIELITESDVEEIEINEEYIESEIDAVIDQENIINQEIDELEASF